MINGIRTSCSSVRKKVLKRDRRGIRPEECSVWSVQHTNGGWVRQSARSVGRGPWTSRLKSARSKIRLASPWVKASCALAPQTGVNPHSGRDTRRRWERGKGANGSIRCCRDSPCHGDKGNGGMGWRISHVKPSRRERRGTALEGLTSMSKATENMGTDEGRVGIWNRKMN